MGTGSRVLGVRCVWQYNIAVSYVTHIAYLEIMLLAWIWTPMSSRVLVDLKYCKPQLPTPKTRNAHKCRQAAPTIVRLAHQQQASKSVICSSSNNCYQ